MLHSNFGLVVDLRTSNSWNKTIDEVDPVEILEVQTINNISPTLLVSGLKELMKTTDSDFKIPSYIINVTSHEGWVFIFVL